MKKLFLLLGMITCLLGLTACGKAQEDVKSFMSEEEAISNAEYVVELIYMIDTQGMDAQYEAYPVVIKALESWRSAAADMGDYKEIKESTATVEEKEATILVTVAGSKRDAVVEVILDKTGYISIATNVTYTLGETMEKAVMNTIMGLGTVFIVLILISFIIGWFRYIPKIQAKFSKNQKEVETKPAPVKAAAPVAAVVDQVEELSDDTELVAVIAAAIAASEGKATTEGFVVRSIKRANTKNWQRA